MQNHSVNFMVEQGIQISSLKILYYICFWLKKNLELTLWYEYWLSLSM